MRELFMTQVADSLGAFMSTALTTLVSSMLAVLFESFFTPLMSAVAQSLGLAVGAQ